MSGLMPGVTLRKTFISASSPKATEELDCSPLNSVEWAVEVELVARQPMELQRRVTSGGVGEGAQPQRHRLAVVQGVVDVGPPESSSSH